MAPDAETPADVCPPVTLPPDSSFPAPVDVHIQGLLLRDAEDLADLNRLLGEIRRIPRREKVVRELDPAFATFLWLHDRVQAGEFDAYPGQYVVGSERRVLGIGPDTEVIVRQAMEADPTLGFDRIVAVRVPDPNEPVDLTG